VNVGLFVCAHNDTVMERATLTDVRITVPARVGFVPYREYIGSNIEIMDVATGHRRIIYRSPASVQAPNWTRDGKALIYNQQGKLYRFDLATGTPTLINTDFAVGNNNDHVLSFDGRMLGISNQSADNGNRSIVYTVPATGGTPTRVTPKGPSYLHGWSPDGRTLIYTGIRDSATDIYAISVRGGEERRLTREAMNDGSEYGPDGRIYFNSTRTGKMQLWRMRADGSAPTQLTNDTFNNWFPHVSPNGRTIVFISFMADISPADHPWYKPVYLRRMPAAGGKPTVLAYLYGGQGTINVPSWSPDGRYVAFVSNTNKY
jgi:TolB protein